MEIEGVFISRRSVSATLCGDNAPSSTAQWTNTVDPSRLQTLRMDPLAMLDQLDKMLLSGLDRCPPGPHFADAMRHKFGSMLLLHIALLRKPRCLATAIREVDDRHRG